MSKTLKIVLLVLLTVLAVRSAVVIGQYFYNLQHASSNVITEMAHVEAPEKKDERSLERQINRFLCRVSEFFTPRVKLPNGYYLEVSNGVVWLHDKKGKVVLDESAQDFLVKEPYVAIWGGKVVYFLNTYSGETSSYSNQDYRELWKRSGELGFDRLRWSDCLTFWDIKTGYKPVTWSQK